MIVTIDGPAGAGKSSAAKKLAKRLGFRFLDTGAMYRAVTWAAVQRQLELSNADLLAELAAGIDISLTGDRVLVDSDDVTDQIRTSAITSQVYHAANNPLVREVMVHLQRREAMGQSIVTEGRDQGTVVFPDAECKIFLTASPRERAHRRQRDLQKRGEDVSFEKVLADQNERDLRDLNRDFGPLVPAHDAITVNTDGFTEDGVVDRLEALVRERSSPHFIARKRLSTPQTTEVSNISEV